MKWVKTLLIKQGEGEPLGSRLTSLLEQDPSFELEVYAGRIDVGEGDPDSMALSQLIEQTQPDLLICAGWVRPDHEAEGVLRSARRSAPGLPVVFVGGMDEPCEVFRLLQRGAVEVVTPPLNPADLLPRLWRIFESGGEEGKGRRDVKGQAGLQGFVGESPEVVAVVNKLPLIAASDSPALITGETGTGKEICARGIHRLSERASGPFVPLNCGALPPELVENELFGHERGAYTGAAGANSGLISEADGGALFLDEVDALSPRAQVALLRFLQDGEYRAIGSKKTRKADVRIIAASNTDLEKLVREGAIRQDLYFRMNVLPLALPPLRQRRDDIPLLVRHFLKKYGLKTRKPIQRITFEALQKLLSHDWPGNVRELENVIERAIALCEGQVVQAGSIDLPEMEELKAPSNDFSTRKQRVVEEFERSYLQSLLVAHNGNVTQAAKAAGKHRRAFWELMRKHHLDHGGNNGRTAATNEGPKASKVAKQRLREGFETR